jgi:hypothetical protein
MALIATGIAASTIAMTVAPAVGASVRGGEWWLSELGVRQAWATTKGSGVTVAVLSDGVDASQADLTGSVTAGPNLVSGAPSSGQFFGQLGTGLASLIAGHGHGAGNASGIMGVAPQAKILSVPVTLPGTDPLLAQTSVAAALPGDIAAGIRYAVAHGASVIDLPIDPGQPNALGTGGATAAAGGSSAEQAAVGYALAHNVVLVAPAGDDGSGSDAPNFPAAYQGVIAVGAFDQGFVKAPWTSHQGYVTITAAGVNVVAAANNGGYQTLNSTSAASAIVAGIAALIRSGYPSLSAAQVRQALISGTKFHGKTAGSGNGTADAQLALAAAAAEVPAGTPAGAGALPVVTQPAPAAAPKSLPSTLLRDGIMSAALLLVLLLLIALYVALSRRRMVRKQEAIAAEWTSRHPQSRYPHAGTEGDRMLEYFAAPLQAPGAGEVLPADQAAKATAVSGKGLFATAGRQGATSRLSGRPVTSRITGAPPTTSPWDDTDGAGRPGSGLASREVSRRPVVSGTPPWGPAVQPDTDLPWAAAATPNLDADTAAFGPSGYAGPVQAGGPAGDAVSPGNGALAPGSGALVSNSGALASGNGAPGPGSGPGRLGGGALGPGGGPGRPGTVAGGPASAAGGPGSAIAAARAGVAAAAQEARARRAGSPPDVLQSPSGPLGTASGSGSLWERSRPDQPSPAGSRAETPAETTWPGKPARSGLAGPSMTGGLDWRKELTTPTSGDPADSASGFAQPPSSLTPEAQLQYPAQQPGGPLPVRQPRRPAAAAPLSPSGSLWERAGDSAEQPAAMQDPGSQPIFVWNPGAPTDSYPTPPRDSGGRPVPESASRESESAAWDIQPRRDSQPWDLRPPDGSSQPHDSQAWDVQPPRRQPADSGPRDIQPQRENRPPWDTQPAPWDVQSPPWDS